jgi:riboflavin kinase/FMN adenylyltransferase
MGADSMPTRGGADFVLEEGTPERPVVATIGVFDGVHRGHQALLANVVESAGAARSSVVIGFEPHPVEVLAPEVPPHRISAPSVHRRKLAATGCDHVWYLPFSRALAELAPAGFVDLLLRRFDLRALWIGYDFRFGKNRAGDADFLREAGERAGFTVHTFGPIESGGRPFSSTWIREALRAGDMDLVWEISGAPFELEGEVVHGLGIGSRELVATANVRPHPRQLLPALGIYAGWALGARLDSPVPAAISVGLRPTIGEDLQVAVEAHLLDWSGDLYGEPLRLLFARRLREERRFAGMDELREAIDRDIARTREVIAEIAPQWAPR